MEFTLACQGVLLLREPLKDDAVGEDELAILALGHGVLVRHPPPYAPLLHCHHGSI